MAKKKMLSEMPVTLSTSVKVNLACGLFPFRGGSRGMFHIHPATPHISSVGPGHFDTTD